MSKYEKPYDIDRPFLTLVRSDPPKLLVRQATSTGYAVCNRGGCFDASYIGSKYRRGRVQGNNGNVSPALTSAAIESLLVFIGVEKGNSRNDKSP